MDKFLGLTIKQLFLFTLLIYLGFAYFNYGHNTGDEYSQIYEFAAYRLGLIPHSELRLWEYTNQIRPSFQIWLVYWIYKGFLWLNPQASVFSVNYAIQALSAMLSLVTAYVGIITFAPKLQHPYQQLLIFLSLFTWLGIYTSIHFNSENIAGKLYLLALFSLINGCSKRRIAWFATAAMLFALAFATRFQIAFSALGVVIWLLVRQRLKWQEWAVLVSVSAVGIFIFNILIDHWFYGSWTLTAYHYYYQNMVTGTMNSYGTDPVYTYIPMIAGYLPWGPLYLIATVWYCYRKPLDIVSLAIVPFFLIHSLIGHKEVRFMLPLIGLMPITISFFCQEFNLLKHIQTVKGWRITAKTIVGLNFIAYLTLLVPAATEIGGWRFIYNNYPNKVTLFYNASKDRKLLFYVRPQTPIIKVSSSQEIQCPNSTTCLYLLDADKQESNIAGKLVYSFFPLSWNQYNYHNWMKNIGHFNIYQLNQLNPK
jgi:phosphatidylinositol glycan class B